MVSKRLVAQKIILPPCVREGREVDVELGLAEPSGVVATRGVVEVLKRVLSRHVRLDDALQARVAALRKPGVDLSSRISASLQTLTDQRGPSRPRRRHASRCTGSRGSTSSGSRRRCPPAMSLSAPSFTANAGGDATHLGTLRLGAAGADVGEEARLGDGGLGRDVRVDGARLSNDGGDEGGDRYRRVSRYHVRHKLRCTSILWHPHTYTHTQAGFVPDRE